jgi:hypothetical protein
MQEWLPGSLSRGWILALRNDVSYASVNQTLDRIVH